MTLADYLDKIEFQARETRREIAVVAEADQQSDSASSYARSILAATVYDLSKLASDFSEVMRTHRGPRGRTC